MKTSINMANPPVRKNNYMDFNTKVILKIALLWPLESRNTLAQFCHHIITGLTICIFAFISLAQLLKMCFSLDLKELSSTVDIFTLTSTALYKMVFLLWNKKRLQNMMDVVHCKFEEMPLQGLDKFRMRDFIQSTRVWSVLYVLSGQIACVCWCFGPLLLEPKAAATGVALTLENRRVLPINIWLPINVAESPAYEITLVIGCFTMFASALIYLSIDCFYFFLIHVICGQLKLVDASLKTLFEINETLKMEQEAARLADDCKKENDSLVLRKDLKKTQELERHRILNQHLEHIVDLHAVVLDLVREIEILFSSCIVVDYLHAILSLSFALFQTQMTNTLLEMAKMYAFLVICIAHQFFNNLFGELLIHAQHMIVNSVYESPWYTGDQRFKRTVRMITTRSLRAIKLNGFKMYILCLNSFLEFCRRIFSYYTVLSEVSKS